MQSVFLVIFTLFWSGITLMFDGLAGHGIYKQFESRHFPCVTGTILRSEIRSHRGSKGGTTYSAAIEYRYEVAGRTYQVDQLRFNKIDSGSGNAHAIANTHPVGSKVEVYYNPADPGEALLFPGVSGADLLLPIFMTPFNMVMLGFWVWIAGWLRERLFRPVAGGVKIISDQEATRIRVPGFPVIGWALAVTGGSGFISIFVVGISTHMAPGFAVAVSTLLVIYGAGLAVYIWQRTKLRSGIYDLVLNHGPRTLELPLTCGRKERISVNVANIRSLSVEQITHRGSKGGVSYTYAPTLGLSGQYAGSQKLADWSDKLKAEDFAGWLRQQLGANIPATAIFPAEDKPGDFSPSLPPLTPDRIRRPENSRIQVNDVVGGREFYFPAARNPGAAMFLSVILAVWSGLIWLMVVMHAPILFPVVFGIFDGLMFWGFLNAWFKSSRVTVNATAVVLTSRWLFFSRTREFSAGDYERFTTKMGMQSGSKIYSDIKLVRRGADEEYTRQTAEVRKSNQTPDLNKVDQLVAARFRQVAGPRGVTVATAIADAGEAEWLAREMTRALGGSRNEL